MQLTQQALPQNQANENKYIKSKKEGKDQES